MKEKTNKVEQKQPEKAHEEIKNAAEIQKTALKRNQSPKTSQKS